MASPVLRNLFLPRTGTKGTIKAVKGLCCINCDPQAAALYCAMKRYSCRELARAGPALGTAISTLHLDNQLAKQCIHEYSMQLRHFKDIWLAVQDQQCVVANMTLDLWFGRLAWTDMH
jgi:hypothetical protein